MNPEQAVEGSTRWLAQERERKMEAALKVMLTDVCTRAVLEMNDPNAVKQAIDALGSDPLAEASLAHPLRLVVERIKYLVTYEVQSPRDAEEVARMEWDENKLPGMRIA